MEGNLCTDYCCSLFANFADDGLTKTPGLINRIHPIFRRSNFDGRKLSHNDYDLLRPSLQLASLFLESESLIPWLVTMFDGKVQTVSGLTIPRSEVIVVNNRKRAEQAYHVYAAPLPGQDMITFNIEGNLEEDEGDFTTAVRGSLNGRLAKIFPHGCRSTVTLDGHVGKIRLASEKALWPEASEHSKYCLASQKTLHSGYSKQHSTCKACSIQWEMLAARFSLVEVLVHEAGHCLYNAAWGYFQPQGEIPQTRDTVGEAGFEIWHALLGGSLIIAATPTAPVARIEGICNKGRPHSSGPMAFLEEWPNYGLVQRYTAIGYALGATGRRPHDDAYHRVPISYVEDLFTQAFWDRVGVDGPEAMKPPKLATWFFRWSDEKENWVSCTAEENECNLGQREMQTQHLPDQVAVKVPDAHLQSPLTECFHVRAKRKRRLSDVGGPGFENRLYALRQ